VHQITGLAWCGRGAIDRVEVSTDNRKAWKDAVLQTLVFKKAHTRFRFDWHWDGSETVITSRYTNEFGDIQSTMLKREHPPSTERRSLTKECGWKDGDRGGLAEWEDVHGRKKERKRKCALTSIGLLMEGVIQPEMHNFVYRGRYHMRDTFTSIIFGGSGVLYPQFRAISRL
jgi:hypothetical protein